MKALRQIKQHSSRFWKDEPLAVWEISLSSSRSSLKSIWSLTKNGVSNFTFEDKIEY